MKNLVVLFLFAFFLSIPELRSATAIPEIVDLTWNHCDCELRSQGSAFHRSGAEEV